MLSRVGFMWPKAAAQIPFIFNRVIRGMSLPPLGGDMQNMGDELML